MSTTLPTDIQTVDVLLIRLAGDSTTGKFRKLLEGNCYWIVRDLFCVFDTWR